MKNATGVSVSSAPDWESPKTIQTWPGKRAQELVNKVATTIAYDGYTGRPGLWGFLCDNIDEEKMHVQEFFKLHLDPAFQDRGEDAPSCQEAQRWFCDYLHCLLGWIEETLDATIPRYEQKRVEFLFSVPTTWKNPAMIAGMEKIIRNAGYGEKRNHVAKISLTEAEAAAVYTAKQSFEKDDVFLVCDAGGGTTDVNLLKVTSASRGNTELIPLGSVEGQAIGSTLINFHAKDIIMNNCWKSRVR
ncbi:hypothetical protein SLS56_010428 [Neofusicoccum ribis]|uniref:Uncharacterized protein n=1 Tax=Neofusicoccum ribis TaxID=45134 RepID=A0ABR3SEH9_9PEZI